MLDHAWLAGLCYLAREVIVDDGPGSARRLLGVFAHPDDEVFCAGGTMARAAEAGAEVMIVSATRGEQGQIRDARVATRRTLGAVREGELAAAAAELGVQRVQVLAYADGTLQQHRSSLGAAITGIMRQYDPDTVITFGADGGYGHPDHVAISELTTEAFRALDEEAVLGWRSFPAAGDVSGANAFSCGATSSRFRRAPCPRCWSMITSGSSPARARGRVQPGRRHARQRQLRHDRAPPAPVMKRPSPRRPVVLRTAPENAARSA